MQETNKGKSAQPAQEEREFIIPQGASALVIGGRITWYNPSSIGHFGIGMRKTSYELWLADQISEGVTPEERARKWQEKLKKLMENESLNTTSKT